MNVHSLSTRPRPPFPYVKATLWVRAHTRSELRQARPATPKASAPGVARRPCLNESRHGAQDLVSHTACAACETTGVGRAAGSNPANGSGVGCPRNWKIAATTLKMHAA